MDVCPFIPLANFTKNETVKLVSDAAKKIGTDLKIPIFLYEENQINEHRKSLPQIRKGQYEHLNEKLTEAGWHPDYGPLTLNSKTGASVIGTRGALVAFNISLETQNLDLAKKIASAMRSSNFKSNDRLTHLRAIAWKMDDYNHVQVSFNLLNYKITSLLDVWLKCNELAQVHATKVIGSELIGLIPEQCLLEVSSYLNLKNQAKEYQINQSIEFLKLNQLKQFDPKIKILEYNLQQYYTTPIDWNILCV
jgi:glutamate formiminotransferase